MGADLVLCDLFLPGLAPDIPPEDLEEFEGAGDPIDWLVPVR